LIDFFPRWVKKELFTYPLTDLTDIERRRKMIGPIVNFFSNAAKKIPWEKVAKAAKKIPWKKVGTDILIATGGIFAEKTVEKIMKSRKSPKRKIAKLRKLKESGIITEKQFEEAVEIIVKTYAKEA
jgi:hypothetical protein